MGTLALVAETLFPILIDVSIKLSLLLPVIIFLRWLLPLGSIPRRTILRGLLILMFALPVLSWTSAPYFFASLGRPEVSPVTSPTIRHDAVERPDVVQSLHTPGVAGIATIVSAVYLCGVLVLLAWMMLGTIGNRRLISQAVRLTDAEIAELLLPGSMPMANSVDVFVCARVLTPSTSGWRRANILLPVGWHAWETSRKRAVLAHELCHARRQDHRLRMLALLNVCVHWFHPLAWLLAVELSRDAEEESDRAGIKAVGSHCRYAEHLLEIAALAESATDGRMHAVAMARPCAELEQRIDRILAGSPEVLLSARSLHIAAFAAGLSLLAVVVSPRIAYAGFEQRPLTGTTLVGAFGSAEGITVANVQRSRGEQATAVIDARPTFQRATQTRSYTLDLADIGEPVHLRFGARVSHGRAVWRLSDPTGEVRDGVQTTAFAEEWTDAIRTIPGRWQATLTLEDATGESWIQWSR